MLTPSSYRPNDQAPTGAPRPDSYTGSWQTAICLKGINMPTSHFSAPRLDRLTIPATSRTLDDLRMNHDNYATSGSFSAASMRPVLITVLVIAIAAGLAIGAKNYVGGADASQSMSAAQPDPSVPAASQVPSTSNVPMTAGVTTAKDSPATDPMSTLTKSEEANSMPLAGHGNNHSSESLNPAKIDSGTAGKSPPTAAK